MNKIENPLVSIIVPSYNHARFITECIESIMNQTYENIELIVIDDGSIDNSSDILNKLQKKYGFKLFSQKNHGIAYTLNRGILELSSGKYFACCASDDYLTVDKVEKQVAFLERNREYSIIAGYAIVVDETSNITRKSKLPDTASIINFEDLFLSKKGFAAGTVMMKTEVFKEVGIYDKNYPIEDRYMWLKLTNAGYHIYLDNQYYQYYRHHSSNTSNNHKWRIENLRKILDIYKSHRLYKEAVYLYKISMINRFSLINKKIAFKFFLSTKPLLKRIYISGVIKMLLPNIISNYFCKDSF